MDQQALSRMKSGEQSWWYRGRQRIIADAIRYAGIQHADTALDFGAGYGAMRSLLTRFATHTFAFEPVKGVVAHVEKEGYDKVFEQEADALARPHGLIGIFDVLEHIEDDQGQLNRLYAALEPGGALVITVPASMILWSTHDVQNQHFRRYSYSSLIRVVEAAGFRVRFVSYWNTILYPLALLARGTGNSGESSFSMPRFIDQLFYSCIAFESFLMRWIPLPIGVSLVLVATKDHEK